MAPESCEVVSFFAPQRPCFNSKHLLHHAGVDLIMSGGGPGSGPHFLLVGGASDFNPIEQSAFNQSNHGQCDLLSPPPSRISYLLIFVIKFVMKKNV